MTEEMNEMLTDVLIKEVRGPDKVFIVNNLPKSLLYTKAKRMVYVPIGAVDYDRKEPKLVPAYVLKDEESADEPRNRRMTNELTDELLPGIEASPTGDNGYVFFVAEYPEAKERLAAIDRYIRAALGPTVHIPERIDYSSQKGSFSAPPRPLSQIPRVELPGVASPTGTAPNGPASLPSPVPPTFAPTRAQVAQKAKKVFSPEQLSVMRANLAAARAKKAAIK